MSTVRRSARAALLAAVLVPAIASPAAAGSSQGKGDRSGGPVREVVSFGDSWSDAGTFGFVFGTTEGGAWPQLLAAEYGDTLYSTGPTVDDLVAGALEAQGRTIATAESCTGGLLVARLTERPGSSAWVLGGVCSYADSAKEAMVDVPAEMIAAHGAVSPQVARALADGARSRFGADVGVGITGVAGPSGGTAEKPVGTVHLCAVGPDGVVARSVRLPGSRSAVRERSVFLALQMLRELLVGGPAA